MDDFNELDDLEVTETIIEKLEKIIPEKDSDELALERLTEISESNKTWIAIPREGGNKVEVFDVENCDNEKFFEWLQYIWFGCKDMKHSAEDYDKLNYKIAAINNIFFLHQKLKFPNNERTK